MRGIKVASKQRLPDAAERYIATYGLRAFWELAERQEHEKLARWREHEREAAWLLWALGA